MINRGAVALIKSTWASWMQYRGFFFVLAFGWMVPPLIYLLVWSTAAGEGAPVGFSRGEFVAYYLILIVINQFTYAQTNWTVGDFIRGGQLNTYLLRPLPYIYQVLADEVAGKVVFMAFVVPVSALLALVLRPELQPYPAVPGCCSCPRWCWPGACGSCGVCGWRCWLSGQPGPTRCWRCRTR